MAVLNIGFVMSLTWAVVKTQRLLVIDADPGVDDTLGLLMALGDPLFKVLAITCVHGNTDGVNVVNNVLRILSVANKTYVPVYKGSNYGLTGSSPESDAYFGQDGLGDIKFYKPVSRDAVQEEHSASFLARVVRELPQQVTILALGPLTNLALALHLNENFLRQALRVVILGGTVRGQGNVAPGKEFNFYMDPDAAAMVMNRALSSGVILTLVPMETVVGNDLKKDWRFIFLSQIRNEAVTFLNTLETKHFQRHPSEEYHPYDAYAVAAVLAPHCVVREQLLHGTVESNSHLSNGVLLVDYMNSTKNAANLLVIMEIPSLTKML